MQKRMDNNQAPFPNFFFPNLYAPIEPIINIGQVMSKVQLNIIIPPKQLIKLDIFTLYADYS